MQTHCCHEGGGDSLYLADHTYMHKRPNFNAQEGFLSFQQGLFRTKSSHVIHWLYAPRLRGRTVDKMMDTPKKSKKEFFFTVQQRSGYGDDQDRITPSILARVPDGETWNAEAMVLAERPISPVMPPADVYEQSDAGKPRLTSTNISSHGSIVGFNTGAAISAKPKLKETEAKEAQSQAPTSTKRDCNSDPTSDKSSGQARSQTSARRHRVWGNLELQAAPLKDTVGLPAGDLIESPSASHLGLGYPPRPRTAPVIGKGRAQNRDTASAVPVSLATIEPIGKWRCCKCHLGHRIYSFAKEVHPISTLNCECIHKSCLDCTFESDQVKRYVPIREPEVIRLYSDSGMQIRFGVVCDGCGLSWRAQEVMNKKIGRFQRISAMHRNMIKKRLHQLQHSQSLTNVPSPATSFTKTGLPDGGSNMDLRQLSREMEKGHGKQVEATAVRFTGIRCTCGLVTDATSLCFQIVDPPLVIVVGGSVGKERETRADQSILSEEAPPSALVEGDHERGYGEPVLRLVKGKVVHPNALRSNPVTAADFPA